MKERRKQKLARMETQIDYEYGSADEAQEAEKFPSKHETISKLSQLEKLYEEKKKVLYRCALLFVFSSACMCVFVIFLSYHRCCSLHFTKDKQS